MSRTRTRPLVSDHPYTAVIGDMLASRKLRSPQRMRVQVDFNQFVDSLNQRYRSALVSEFAITLGDEFQGILSDPRVIPEIIWDVSNAAKLPRFRLGVGYGAIHTIIPRRAINLDGPGLHHARAAIETARHNGLLGGVFCGFGSNTDVIANGIARLLQFHFSRRSPAQLRILGLLRAGHSQAEIARITGKTPQAINSHKNASGWDAYRAGEEALRRLLNPKFMSSEVAGPPQ